jgi:secretion/DNA translocation related TadE-like protein
VSLEGERGSATVVAVAMIAVLLAMSLGFMAIGSAVVARHRAQAGADLAALAAAGRLANGGDTACSWASSVAARMQSHVSACRVDELDVVVAVDVPVRLGRWGMGTAHAAARAGPADAAQG